MAAGATTTKQAPQAEAPKEEKKAMTLRDHVRVVGDMLSTPAVAKQIAALQTKYLTPERLTGILLGEVAKPDPKDGRFKLLEAARANPASFLRAVMGCSQLGLEPGPGSLVYLIPYKTETQFIIGFKGYIHLADRSGIAVTAKAIYENEFFDWEDGTAPFIKHKPLLINRGQMIGAYAIARPHDGSTLTFDVLNMEDIERARKSSKASGGPWSDHFSEMSKKTAIRRLAKQLNLSPEAPLSLANRLDDDAIDVTSETRPQRVAPPSLRAALGIATPEPEAPAIDPGADFIDILPEGEVA